MKQELTPLKSKKPKFNLLSFKEEEFSFRKYPFRKNFTSKLMYEGMKSQKKKVVKKKYK